METSLDISVKYMDKYRSPHRAVVLCGILGIFFILSGSIKIVALMCSYNQIQAYIIGFWSFLALTQKKSLNLRDLGNVLEEYSVLGSASYASLYC